jgi:hypothetical protein
MHQRTLCESGEAFGTRAQDFRCDGVANAGAQTGAEGPPVAVVSGWSRRGVGTSVNARRSGPFLVIGGRREGVDGSPRLSHLPKPRSGQPANLAGGLRGFALAMALASSNPASHARRQGPCRDRFNHSVFRPLSKRSVVRFPAVAPRARPGQKTHRRLCYCLRGLARA